MFAGLTSGLEAWSGPALAALLTLAVTLLLFWIVVAVVRRLGDDDGTARLFLDAAAPSLGASLALLALDSALRAIPEELPLLLQVRHVVELLLIVAVTWVALRCTTAVGDLVVRKNPVDEHRWKHARKVETQTRFFVRGLTVLIVIIGLGMALMTFDTVRQLGVSLLASAGIGGVILGFAARPVLGNLLAGMQIALTQPFRIDDVLIVDGKWCWVEEVTATYVVLRVWDLRRLVVPLDWFITNHFENWSRNSTELMGTVFLWVDYAMPVQPLRDEFARLLRQSPKWDGQTENVLVTDASDRAIEIRFLMGAANSLALWELRCAMREDLIAFVRDHYPQHLPRLRARLVDDGAEASAHLAAGQTP
ncbi:MAG TPA: mechanosensitive ion channel domain-containing protein [Pseudomonadales bacterium]|nr:mechanosensitive ion channel domain-containing protein [Pseudomonadales bacterium]